MQVCHRITGMALCTAPYLLNLGVATAVLAILDNSLHHHHYHHHHHQAYASCLQLHSSGLMVAISSLCMVVAALRLRVVWLLGTRTVPGASFMSIRWGLSSHAAIHRIHSFISSIHPFIHSFIHPFIHSFIRASIHSFVHSFIRSFVHSSIHPFVHSCIHPLIHSSVHSFRPVIHSFVRPFVRLLDSRGIRHPVFVGGSLRATESV